MASVLRSSSGSSLRMAATAPMVRSSDSCMAMAEKGSPACGGRSVLLLFSGGRISNEKAVRWLFFIKSMTVSIMLLKLKRGLRFFSSASLLRFFFLSANLAKKRDIQYRQAKKYLPYDSAGLKINSIHFDKENSPFEFASTVWVGELTKFQLTMTKDS